MPKTPSDDPVTKVRASLLRNYFTDGEYLASEAGRNDLASHLEARLKSNREKVIPWIETFLPLSDARVLEIGCGTGASTLALAERGAKVTAIDILPNSIEVAKDRCRAYGCTATFLVANAADVKSLVRGNEFDAILFYAALEHMTHEERRAAMRDTWQMLAPGAFWVVIETPNRLWYMDKHTSLLPFFNWLPDRLAFEYSKFSKRTNFRELYELHTPEAEIHFLRRGRGVSFHEFELFMAPREELDVVACLNTYLLTVDPDARHAWSVSDDAAYEELLRRACPGLHPAFLQPNLDLAIRKSSVA